MDFNKLIDSYINTIEYTDSFKQLRPAARSDFLTVRSTRAKSKFKESPLKATWHWQSTGFCQAT